MISKEPEGSPSTTILNLRPMGIPVAVEINSYSVSTPVSSIYLLFKYLLIALARYIKRSNMNEE